jgi:CRISPR-associated protein Csb1
VDYASLAGWVASDAALRRRQRLQPVGGRGDKIFPPTYPGEGRNAGPRHVFERRRIDGADVWCVLVDSVQSQANRLEEALLAAVRDGSLALPHVVVDFTGCELAGVETITSLDAPHRVYDAILRDSLLDGQPFMKSPLGQRLAAAKPNDATALLETSPSALLFGAWHSTGEGGGLGAKFARCLVSEIVAVNTPVEEIADQRSGEIEPRTSGRRTGSRIDPLGVLRKVEVYKGPGGWDIDPQRTGRGAKKVRPSEINHGNIAPTVQPLGVTCDYAEHVAVISLAGLRRLGFGGGERDTAGRALLAALGLAALTEQDARGYALRSRCDLVCEERAPLEVVHADGGVEPVSIDRAAARRLYADACAAARDAGFALAREPIRLTPQDKLVAIVRRSQQLALAGEGGETDEAG